MKEWNIRRYWILILVLLAGTTTACEDDATQPVVVDEAAVLVEYLEANNPIHVSDWITPATTVNNALLDPESNVLVIDIRSADAFTSGHVPGAVNVALGDLPTWMAANDGASYDDVFLVCYSGQSAAFAVGALRALGYDNVSSMKFGMSSWHTDFDSWSGNVKDSYATELVTTASPDKAPAGNLPALSTGFESAEDILAARVQAVFVEGFGPNAVSIDELWPDRDDYYIVNYWSADHYLGMGHLPEAIMYEPTTEPFFLANDLTTVPADQKVVIYCYTGQTSAFLAGYLNVLGYDAYTLKFGMNGMAYSSMTEGAWSAGAIQGNAYETD